MQAASNRLLDDGLNIACWKWFPVIAGVEFKAGEPRLLSPSDLDHSG